jgi:hypothetical protein
MNRYRLISAQDKMLIAPTDGSGRVEAAMIHTTASGRRVLRRNDGMKSRDVTRIMNNPVRLEAAITKVLA